MPSKMNLFLFRCSALRTHAMIKISQHGSVAFCGSPLIRPFINTNTDLPLSYERGWHWLAMDVVLDAAVVG
jgi:hypothetical protein